MCEDWYLIENQKPMLHIVPKVQLVYKELLSKG